MKKTRHARPIRRRRKKRNLHILSFLFLGLCCIFTIGFKTYSEKPGSAVTREIKLPSYQVYGVQVGVFNNEEHAQSELKRLWENGEPCTLWRDHPSQIRIIAEVAFEKDNFLSLKNLQTENTYVMSDQLKSVQINITASEKQHKNIEQLLTLPDQILQQLLSNDDDLSLILNNADKIAECAQRIHSDNAVYVQLAQSVKNWCVLIQHISVTYPPHLARRYATATMALLCKELRVAFMRSSV